MALPGTAALVDSRQRPAYGPSPGGSQPKQSLRTRSTAASAAPNRGIAAPSKGGNVDDQEISRMGAHGGPACGRRTEHPGRCAGEGDPLGNVAGGLHRQPDGHQPGAGAQQGGAGLQLLGSARRRALSSPSRATRSESSRGTTDPTSRSTSWPTTSGGSKASGRRWSASRCSRSGRSPSRWASASTRATWARSRSGEICTGCACSPVPVPGIPAHRSSAPSPCSGSSTTTSKWASRKRDRCWSRAASPPWGSTPTPRRPPPGGSRRLPCRPTGRR